MSRALVWLGIGLAACSVLSCADSQSNGASLMHPDMKPVLQGYAFADVATLPLGLYQLTVSGDTVELRPDRRALATPGQLYHVDLTDALASTFCRDCLTVESFARIPAGVRFVVRLRHPFALADDGRPPDAQNRRDLWVSTVKGVLLSDATQEFFAGSLAADPSVLMSPDGYTTLLTPGIAATATAYPYQVFGASGANVTAGNFSPESGWTGNPDAPTGFLILANHQTTTATYELVLEPGETVETPFALTASFSPGATGPESRLTPSYYMPAGAPPEAWRVTTRLDGELDPYNTSSNVNLHIEVCDWQQDPGLMIDAAFPVASDRWRIPVASRIATVELSLPALTGEPSIAIDIDDGSGAGTVADPWQLNVPLKNGTAAGPGTYHGLLRVTDERDPQSTAGPFGTTSFIGPDLATPYAAPAEFATYAVVTAVVAGTPDCLPVFEVFHGEADLYIPGEPLYQLVRTRDDLDALLETLQTEPTEVLFDEGQSSVIVAVGGWYFAGRGQRDIDIVSACPINNKLHIAVQRTEAAGGCNLTGAPTAPLEIAVIDSRNSSHVFNETIIDWCGATCEPAAWTPLADGDAATSFGYAGGLLEVYCADQGAYDTVIAQLGMTAPPSVDFTKDILWVLCSGAEDDPDSSRFVEVLEVCQVPGSGRYRLTWQHGEYASCDPASAPQSAPYLLLTLPRNTGGGESIEYRDDVCAPSFDCAPDIAPEVAFGDYPANTQAAPQAVLISNEFEYTPLWNAFFADVPTRPAQPPIDLEIWDALLLSSGWTANGHGLRSLHITSLCLEKTPGILHLAEQREEVGACPDPVGASHPWTLILIPTSGPYTLDRQVTTLLACREVTNCQSLVPIADGLISDYLDHAARSYYFGQVSFPDRIAAFEAAWSLVSDDPPPGLTEWSPDKARFLFLYGFRLDDLGGYRMRLESFCQEPVDGRWIAEVARVSAPNDCVLPGIRNSAWAVYEVPLLASEVQIDIELAEECPDP